MFVLPAPPFAVRRRSAPWPGRQDRQARVSGAAPFLCGAVEGRFLKYFLSNITAQGWFSANSPSTNRAANKRLAGVDVRVFVNIRGWFAGQQILFGTLRCNTISNCPSTSLLAIARRSAQGECLLRPACMERPIRTMIAPTTITPIVPAIILDTETESRKEMV